MVDWNLKVGGVFGEYDKVELPAPPATVIEPHDSYLADEIETSSYVYQWSDTLPSPVVVPASFLEAGKKFLILASAAIGHGTGTGGAPGQGRGEVFLAEVPGSVNIHAGQSITEGLQAGTPRSIRGSRAQRLFVYEGVGRALAFAFRSLNGYDPFVLSNLHITAIPLEDAVEGVDYVPFGDPLLDTLVAPLSFGAPASPFLSAQHTPAEQTDYLALAACELAVDQEAGQQASAHLYVDAASGSAEMRRSSSDSTERHCYARVRELSLTPAAHTLELRGYTLEAGATGQVWRPTITLLRKAFFQTVLQTTITNETITADWPAQQTLKTITYTPTTDDRVLLIGFGMVERGAQGSLCMSITKDGAQVLETNASGAIFQSIADKVPVVVFAVDTIASAHTYRLLAGGTSPLTGSFIRDCVFYAISLTRNLGPQHVVWQETEQHPVQTEVLAGDLPSTWIETEQHPAQSESFSAIVDNPPGGGDLPPHPRIWVQGKVAELQAKLPDADYTNWVNISNSTWVWHNKAFKWLMEGGQSNLDAALDELESRVENTSLGSLFVTNGQESFLRWPPFAMAYDWLYEHLDERPGLWRKCQDFFLTIGYVCIQCGGQPANDPLNTGYLALSGQTLPWWGRNSPSNNFYTKMMQAQSYISAALQGDQASDFVWPPNGSDAVSRYPFTINRVAGSGNPATEFTDYYEWYLDRLEFQALPRWHELGDGGFQLEGSSYGYSWVRTVLEQLCMIQDSGGPSLAAQNPELVRDAVYALIYNKQPGTSQISDLGDLTSGRAIGSTHWAQMLYAMQTLRGQLVAQHAKFWIEENFPSIMGSGDGLRLFPFLCDRASYAARDYRLDLPLWYFAPGGGFFWSRSSWDDDADEITVWCGDNVEEHADHDQGGIQMYKGGAQDAYEGWLITDAKRFGSGDSPHPQWHSMLWFKGQWNPYKNTGSQLNPYAEAVHGSPSYHYYRMNLTAQSRGGQCGHTGYGNAVTADYAAREIFRLLAPNLLIVHDRVNQVSDWQVYPDNWTSPNFCGSGVPLPILRPNIEQLWHFPRRFPSGVVPGTLRYDNAENQRLFHRTLLPYPTSDMEIEIADFSPSPDTRRFIIRHNPPSQYLRWLTVMEPTTQAQANMADMELIGGGPFEGVAIYPDANTVKAVLFPTDPDGNYPTSGDYTAPKRTTNRHFVCGLKPNQEYLVNPTEIMATYQVTVAQAPAGTGNVLSSPGGVIEFDPDTIGDPGQTVFWSETEFHPPMGETMRTIVDVVHPMTEQHPPMGEVLEHSVATTHEQWIATEQHPVQTEFFRANLAARIIEQHPPMGETLVVETTKGIEEKKIELIRAYLQPNEDTSVAFFYPDPNDGVVYDKLRGTFENPDWSTLARVQAFIGFARGRFRLDLPDRLVGQPYRARFVAGLKRVVPFSPSIEMRSNLLRSTDLGIVASYQRTLYIATNDKWQSPWIRCAAAKSTELLMEIEFPGAVSGNMVELALAGWEVEGYGEEKSPP